MAAFHHPLAYKTQITHFDRRFQVNPLRNGIGADIRELPLRNGSAPCVSIRAQIDGIRSIVPVAESLRGV